MIKGAIGRFRQGLRKTRDGVVGRLQSMFGGRVKLDEDTLDQIEELLISADMGVSSAVAITGNIEKRLKEEGGEASLESVLEVIRNDVKKILTEARPKVRPPSWDDQEAGTGKKKKKKKKGKNQPASAEPAVEPDGGEPAGQDLQVIFVVGVNGTGKTTSIAKLAHYHQSRGDNVILAAADTFRAAAVEQLETWSRRIEVPLISGQGKQDPAAVAYTACERALEEEFDYLIVDTAGRLHTQTNLMRELEKVRRVIAKKIEGAPHEVLLVLDATVGQNAISQAEAFNRAIRLTGIVLAKLDGTAKGGIVVTLNNRFRIPVKYVGLGEKVEDLAEFAPEKFVEALFG